MSIGSVNKLQPIAHWRELGLLTRKAIEAFDILLLSAGDVYCIGDVIGEDTVMGWVSVFSSVCVSVTTSIR